jgi:hypothetical protein
MKGRIPFDEAANTIRFEAPAGLAGLAAAGCEIDALSLSMVKGEWK